MTTSYFSVFSLYFILNSVYQPNVFFLYLFLFFIKKFPARKTSVQTAPELLFHFDCLNFPSDKFFIIC